MTDTLLIIGGLVYLGIGLYFFDRKGKKDYYYSFSDMATEFLSYVYVWWLILIVDKLINLKVPKRYRRGE